MRSMLIFLIIVLISSSFGAVFRPGPWYDELIKPALNPPGWIFTPVWIILYLMIAISGWLLWKKCRSLKNPAVIFWAIQMILNALWSWIFFGLEMPFLSFINISLLLVFILFYIFHTYPLSRAASLLFVPYALWVGFASYLNLGIVILN